MNAVPDTYLHDAVTAKRASIQPFAASEKVYIQGSRAAAQGGDDRQAPPHAGPGVSQGRRPGGPGGPQRHHERGDQGRCRGEDHGFCPSSRRFFSAVAR